MPSPVIPPGSNGEYQPPAMVVEFSIDDGKAGNHPKRKVARISRDEFLALLSHALSDNSAGHDITVHEADFCADGSVVLTVMGLP